MLRTYNLLNLTNINLVKYDVKETYNIYQENKDESVLNNLKQEILASVKSIPDKKKNKYFPLFFYLFVLVLYDIVMLTFFNRHIFSNYLLGNSIFQGILLVTGFVLLIKAVLKDKDIYEIGILGFIVLFFILNYFNVFMPKIEDIDSNVTVEYAFINALISDEVNNIRLIKPNLLSIPVLIAFVPTLYLYIVGFTMKVVVPKKPRNLYLNGLLLALSCFLFSVFLVSELEINYTVSESARNTVPIFLIVLFLYYLITIRRRNWFDFIVVITSILALLYMFKLGEFYNDSAHGLDSFLKVSTKYYMIIFVKVYEGPEFIKEYSFMTFAIPMTLIVTAIAFTLYCFDNKRIKKLNWVYKRGC